MECSRRDCRKKTSVLVAGYCPHCAARCIADLREEICRLQNTNNELVREQWVTAGERTVVWDKEQTEYLMARLASVASPGGAVEATE